MLAELGYLDSPASEACYLARYHDWAEQSSVLHVLMKERIGRRYALEDPKPVLLLATTIVRADKRSGGRSAVLLNPCNSHRSTSENSPGYIEDAFVSYFRRIHLGVRRHWPVQRLGMRHLKFTRMDRQRFSCTGRRLQHKIVLQLRALSYALSCLDLHI